MSPLKCLCFVALIMIVGVAMAMSLPKQLPEGQPEPYRGDIVLIEEAFLMPMVAPCYPAIYTLGTLIENSTELMDKIMECESHTNPTADNPKSSAYGLCQMLTSTRKYCERKWGLEIDKYNPEHQGYACERLLREEGTDHWKTTKFCWNK